MIKENRRRYNDAFTEERYQEMMTWLTEQYGHRPKFHVAESPIFVPNDVRDHLMRACEDVLEVVLAPGFAERSEPAIPAAERVPGQTDRPMFLQLDFGLCRNEAGEIVPQLIEGQGFPSLYFFQFLLDQCYRRFFPIPEDFTCRFGGMGAEDYLDLLRRCILGKHAPENVVLLEVDPLNQTTRIDFVVACQELGIAELCISDVEVDGTQLFYQRQGVRTRIERIYNRVIFDELNARTDLQRQFNLVEPVDVEWAGHPNWFFLLSKYTLPFINSPYVPETRFLHEIRELPQDLEAYVLKPLYSFAGAGVDLHPTPEKIAAIAQPEHFILQKKVQYADLIETPDGPARTEIRMMYVWPDDAERPILLNNLVRLSKGEMIGVRYNKGKTWVGGSLGYFAP
ncbi:hypothetical protein QWY85_16685 [Neolewinella lacunae]|uniref:Circularly permuted type 2 ATP-grasp protein n=1 Tax=Neolewinella lacunae TaxID=1517758 RepID=A0A923PHK3_9BACT|nr:hypothetical protein [Neolewinella lacunae]MBC6993419.1 hypothetical protein [Neolewinella lacunae]MDN3636305.1 hypothetical protein [Neolewinella lacunae]